MAEHGGRNVIYGTICNVSVGATVRHNEQVFKAATGTTEPIRTKLQSWIGELMRKIQANLRATLALRHSYFPSLGKTVSIPMETFSFDSLWMSRRDGTGFFPVRVCLSLSFLEVGTLSCDWWLETWDLTEIDFKIQIGIYDYLYVPLSTNKLVQVSYISLEKLNRSYVQWMDHGIRTFTELESTSLDSQRFHGQYYIIIKIELLRRITPMIWKYCKLPSFRSNDTLCVIDIFPRQILTLYCIF